MNSLTIALNLMRRMIRTRKDLFFYLLLPCLVISGTIALLGQNDTSENNIIYLNQDQGPAGSFLVQELSKSRGYHLMEAKNQDEIKQAVKDHNVWLGFTLPANFSSSLLAGEEPKAVTYELTDSEPAYTFKLNLAQNVERLSQAAAAVAAPDENTRNISFKQVLAGMSQPQVKAAITDEQLYTKPGLTNVTGFTLMFLMGLITSTVSIINQDRIQRTMARIFSAPVRSYEMVLGNFIGSFAVGAIQIVIILLVTRGGLGYDYGLPLGAQLLIMLAFLLVTMGIASTVSGLIRNQSNAGMLNTLIIIPTCMLGGCFWPIKIMPDYLQKAANFVPQKWVFDAMDTIGTGGTIADIWLPLSVLGLMAAILLAIGSVILRPQEGAAGA
ncbi:ABC transporter permease [Paenibacillus sp. JX-17]|uniref:ABC transporter permease n=1 Tax=Paenibacillus lacisoli TaxID=3064525 RepID=A0ABT9CBI3_9BACL|nr:ABC transporter permease [Paenibacillus sp. JX-17]MDO7906618.1 ABC transporter permease [Paenibacillus sp. JX-17]